MLGDFNAKSEMWGSSKTNYRGKLVIEWAAEWDMHLVNNSGVSTCVLWQRESVVDLIWATPEVLRKTERCEVLEDIESLGDHRYILLDLHPKVSPGGEAAIDR